MKAALATGFVVLCVALGARASAAEIASLYVIPTESKAKDPIPAGTPARVRLTSNDAAQLAEILAVKLAPGATTFDYTMAEYPQLPAPADHDWLAPTFLIDFDEPVFAELAPELEALGAKPTPAQIVALVNRIVDENIPRGWDIASQVAKRRAGDCTEHAVLTAALLRKVGYPARVVVGVALIEEGETYGAFGHAWAERLDGQRWVVADAALLDAAQGSVRYLPIGVVDNEGVGYTTSLMRHMRAWISKVVVLGRGPTNAAGAATR